MAKFNQKNHKIEASCEEIAENIPPSGTVHRYLKMPLPLIMLKSALYHMCGIIFVNRRKILIFYVWFLGRDYEKDKVCKELALLGKDDFRSL